MKKNNLICLTVSGGADAIYVFINGRHVCDIDHMVEVPNALAWVLQEKTPEAEWDMVSVDMDFRSEKALDNFYNRQNEKGEMYLTEEEQEAAIHCQGDKITKLWEAIENE